MNRFNLSLFIVLALLIAGLWTCNSCQKAEIERLKGQPGKVTVKTVTKTDTIYKKEVLDLPVYVPQSYAVYHRVVDSFTAYETLPVDTAAILRDYTATVVYNDSAQVQYGKIYIQDTLSRNRITARQVRTSFTIPVVTTTITNTVQAPKRAQVYAGINFQGTKADLLTGFGPSLLLKTKQDRMIEVGALYGRGGEWLYTAGIKFKLSFKK